MLREKGPVRLVDAHALPGSSLEWRADGRAHLGATVAEVLAACGTGGPVGAVVVAVTPFHRPPARCDVLGATLEGLKALFPGVPLVLADCYQSGQHYVESQTLLEAYPEADAWVKYEAELTVPALRAAGAPKGVHRGASPVLDALPLPAWDLVSLPAYQRFHQRVVQNLGRGGWAFPIDGRTLPLVTSRGCPYSCVHCSSNPERERGAPKTQRRYGAAKLKAYLGELERVHGATRLEVLDELINVNEAHFDTFLSEVSSLGLKFDVPNGMRADYLEPRHFAAMKGRVATVSVSAESGVQRVVTEVVKKKLDLGAISSAAEAAHAAQVPLMIHFMIGLPGETAQEINGTLAYAMDLYDRFGAWPAVQFATPLPGTALAGSGAAPQVDDWGPRFQMAPSDTGAQVSAEELRRFKWTFDERMRASNGPQKLIMNVTYVCNNHCTFCAVGTRTQLHGHPTRQREHLDRYRAQGVTMVDFDGGEPTMNPELVSLVRYARHIGFTRVNVTTNGRMAVYEEFARRLVGSGLTTLLFSVHGPDAQTHAQQVGVAEAFEQTMKGMDNCVRLKPATVDIGLNITVTRSNHDKLEAVAQLALDHGVRWMNIQFLTPFGRATKGLMPDTEVAAKLAMRCIDRFKDRMKFQIINLPFCFMPGYEQYLMGDLLKLERHMVFVNNEDVNLSKYLAERRTRKPVCETCPHAVFCGGFYELENVPEPPWVFDEEDAARPLPEAPGVQLPVLG
ncbi:MAG: radical SAM protein [Archangiaceae bacterium]|nr:radical SAM protein [Archangiaceae bacterium]